MRKSICLPEDNLKNKSRFSKTTFLIFLAFCPAFTFAQTQQYRHFDVDDGLPSSTVYNLIQDSKGYMWFATENGVSKFDGTLFENFTRVDGLMDNEVLELTEDSKGRIWFHTFSGGPCFYQDGKIHNPINDSLLKKIKFTSLIDALFEDSKGNIIISFYKTAIVTITGTEIKTTTTESVQEIPPKTEMPLGLTNILWEEANALYCMVTIGDNTYKFEFYPNQEIHGRMKIQNAPQMMKFPVLGRTIGTTCFVLGYGIYDLSFSNEAKEIYEFNKMSVQSLSRDHEQSFWIMTKDEGAFRVKKDASGKYGSVLENYLPGKSVVSAELDHENNLWFSTKNDGVYFLKQSKITNYYFDFNVTQNSLTQISFDKSGKLFGVLNKQNLVELGYPPFADKLDPQKIFYGGDLYYFRHRPSDRLFISGGGITIFGPGSFYDDNFMKIINGPTHGASNDHIVIRVSGANKSIVPFGSAKNLSFIGSDENILVAGSYGLSRMQANYETNQAQSKRVYKKRAFDVCWDGKNTAWFTSQEGLMSLDLSSEKVTSWSEKFPELKQTFVSIIYSPNGAIWIANNGNGLYRFQNQKIDHFVTQDGLSSNSCKKIIQGPDENVLWILTNNGINKMDLSKNSKRPVFTQITALEGLASNEVTDLAFRHDTLFVATSKGLSVFREKDLVNSSVLPPTYITHIRVADKDTHALRLNLPYYLNDIGFRFVGISFGMMGNVTYQYRLLGIDTTWTTTQFPEVKFTSLAPGDYTFEVIARTKGGIKSSLPATYSFTIAMPWFKSLYFYFGMGFLAVLSLAAIFYLILKSQSRKERVRRQIQEAEHKGLRVQMNPHFISNSLSSVQRSVLKEDKMNAVDHLADLGSLIRRILENSDKSILPLNEEIETCRLYLGLEGRRTNNQFQYKISVDERINVNDIQIPPMLIQPFLENAIWHGLVPREKSGLISLRFLIIPDGIRCEIEDNGVGRKYAALTNQSSGTKHRSMGMDIIKERIGLINQSGKKKINIEVADLTNPLTGDATGTKITIDFLYFTD